MQTDFDGNYSYLGNMIKVTAFLSEATINIFPNPVGEEARLVIELYNGSKHVRIKISNDSGKIVFDDNRISDSDGKVTITFDNTKMNKGFYSLQVSDDSGAILSSRLIKI